MIQVLTSQPFIDKAINSLLIDVRSPAEYLHAHIPDAINIPLFSDLERHEVGTAYKKVSRQDAIKIGLDYFGPKMRLIVEQVEHLMSQYNTSEILVYCWRGGMRSGAVAWLLDLYGMKVSLLKGGYKGFRSLVLHRLLTDDYNFFVLGGYTGAGKTAYLHQLASTHQVLDLEGLANHKGSAFGHLGMEDQPTQEMFENKLAITLSRMDKALPIWTEDESQRLGHVYIPKSIYDQLQCLPIHMMQVPFDTRLQNTINDYGRYPREQLIEATKRISKRLGGLDTQITIKKLQEDDIPGAFAILLSYYDRWYQKSIDSKERLIVNL